MSNTAHCNRSFCQPELILSDAWSVIHALKEVSSDFRKFVLQWTALVSYSPWEALWMSLFQKPYISLTHITHSFFCLHSYCAHEASAHLLERSKLTWSPSLHDENPHSKCLHGHFTFTSHKWLVWLHGSLVQSWYTHAHAPSSTHKSTTCGWVTCTGLRHQQRQVIFIAS